MNAYYERQLLPNFELWAEIICGSICFYKRNSEIVSVYLSSVRRSLSKPKEKISLF